MPENYSQSPLAKKLAVKPNTRIIAINAPEWYRGLLGDLPEGTIYADTFDGAFDWIHLFVKNKAELENQLAEVKAKFKPGGILWISFSRAKKATDLNRGVLFEMDLEKQYQLQMVANAVVNDEWTAYRLKLVKGKSDPSCKRKRGPEHWEMSGPTFMKVAGTRTDKKTRQRRNAPNREEEEEYIRRSVWQERDVVLKRQQNRCSHRSAYNA